MSRKVKHSSITKRKTSIKTENRSSVRKKPKKSLGNRFLAKYSGFFRQKDSSNSPSLSNCEITGSPNGEMNSPFRTTNSTSIPRLSLQDNNAPTVLSRQRHHKSINKRKHKSLYVSAVVALHLLAIAVGISTILGTTIAIANSFNSPSNENQTISSATVKVQSKNNKQLEQLFPVAALGQKIPELTAKISALAAQYPDLEPEIFLIDLDTKGYVNIKGNAPLSSASTIKLPILVALFQDVDQGKIDLAEKLTLTQNLIGGGSGNMQYEKPGTQFTILETATRMMTISDNTATNMLIDRLGGMDALNQRFLDWSLAATRLRNPLPDLTGTNTTSPEDLGNLLAQVERGDIVSLRSRDRLMYIMRNIVRDTLLPQGLESDALIAHKTGDIKSVLGDVGLIDMPNGKRYIASVLVKRPDNDPQAKEFIQKMSQIAYQYFKQQSN